MMIIPLVGGYVKMLTGIMRGISVNESSKKFLALLTVMILGGIVLDLIYVLSFMVFTGGVLGTVLMRVYVFVLIGVGMWIILATYVSLRICIADNYKVLGLGILPLIIFFVKVCGSYILIWFVIIYAIFNVL